MQSLRNFQILLFSLIIVFMIIATTQVLTTSYAQGASCPGAPPSRLVVGEQGIVGPTGANNVRSQAATSGELLGQIPGGGVFLVLEGPVCANGLAWWRVDYNGLIGWTAEGQGADYWLEPGGPLPTQAPPVTAAATVTSEAACPGSVPSRLIVGERGRVVPGPANNVRAEPSTGAERTGDIPGGATFLVLEGPVCAGGFAWWRVDYLGRTGWTPEGSGTDYWLEPAGPVPTQAPTLTPTLTLTPSLTFTPAPPTPTLTPSPTFTPTPVMPEVRTFPNIHQFISNPAPEREAITLENVHRIQPLTLIGRGNIDEFIASSDGERLAVRNGLGIWLVDMTTPEKQAVLLDTEGLVIKSIDFSPNGKYLAVGGNNTAENSTLQFWNTELFRRMPMSRTLTDPITVLKFAPDERLIVGTSTVYNQDTRLFYRVDIERDSVSILNIELFNPATSIAASANNGTIAVSDGFGAISLYSRTTNEHQFSYSVVGRLGDLHIHDATGHLVSAGNGGDASTPGVLRIWNLVNSERVVSPQFSEDIFQIEMSPDGNTLAVYTGGQSTLWLWDMSTLEQIGEYDLGDAFNSVAFTPDRTLLVSHDDGKIYEWDADFQNRELVLDFSGSYSYNSAAANNDGSLVAFGMANGLYLWDTANGVIIDSVEDELNYATEINFDKDSDVLRYNFGVQRYMWDIESGEQSPTNAQPLINTQAVGLSDFAASLYPPSTMIESAHYVPGTIENLVLVDQASTLTFWQKNTRQPLASVRHPGYVVGFSQDGSLLITSTNGIFWLWGVPK